MKYYLPATIVILITIFVSCTQHEPNYPKRLEAVLPDVPVNFEAMNSTYDDYNMASPIAGYTFPLCFSTNRNGQGNKFDIIYKLADLYFNVYNGKWTIGENTSTNLDVYSANANIKDALGLINTPANELGPYLIPKGAGGYYSGNGFIRFQNYIFMYASDEAGQLDIKFTHNLTNYTYGKPQSISFLNSSGNDAYPVLTADSSSIYFCSDRGGNFDIYMAELKSSGDLLSRISSSDPVNIKKIDVLSTPYDDKCPFITGNIMVFTSNRPGGKGGYDLYYSIFQNNKWSEAINFGDKINTQYDEYRPILIKGYEFKNDLLLFSSNRPGGKGGFDLYYVGVDE